MNWKDWFFLAAIFRFLKPKKSVGATPVEKPIDTESTIEPATDKPTEDAPPLLITIGLDFGTAFTKVVVNGAGQKYGIPIRENKNGIDKYLLPTCIYENSFGDFALEESTEYRLAHSDLKMNILDENLTADTEQRIVFYIAQVLRKTRDWVLDEKRDVFGGNRLEWEVNIGLPTEKYADDELKGIYQRLVDKAWYQSTEKQAHGNARRLDRTLINGFPEFLAQIQTYYQSPQLQQGVHAIVDVGAATIDATVFIVDDDRDKHPILAESVEKLGANFAYQHQDNGTAHSEFESKLQKQLNNTLLRAYRNAPRNPEWQENRKDPGRNKNVPLFVCGGGARMPLYKKFYKEKFIRAVSHTAHGDNLEHRALPMLDELQILGVDEKDHDRLSVAYGLSVDLIGKEIASTGPFRPA